MKAKYYWILERHNPQLGVYYIAYGNMPSRVAKEHEGSIYGHNYMLKFDSEEEYNQRINELKSKGVRVISRAVKIDDHKKERKNG